MGRLFFLLRRRAGLALVLCGLLVLLGSLLALRTLKAAPDGPAPPWPEQPPRPQGGARGAGQGAKDAAASPPPPPPPPPPPVALSSPGRPAGAPSALLHAFYYTWYGTPRFDLRFVHWDHATVPHWEPKISASYPEGRHRPPQDLAASFYPALGPYSSRDPAVLEDHMRQLRQAAIGVLVLSWCPPGMADDHGEPPESLVPFILDAAQRYAIQVTFHIQPYKGRDDNTLHSNVKYILDKYGTHRTFYRCQTSTGRNLPLFYIYDSYLTPPEAWANLLGPSGSHSLRDTPHDALFIALLVEEGQQQEILAGGFDGIYTYFASNGFSYGSSHQNWKAIKAFCDANNLLFVPSVGPGYIDTSIRPWNNHNTRSRVNGKYYETALQAALAVRPEIVSITSFNEWHEGTQIEKAVPKKTRARLYLDYSPQQPDIYLELTRRWAEQYSKEKEQWLM